MKKITNRPLVMIIILLIVVAISGFGIWILTKSFTEDIESIDLDRNNEEALAELKYEMIPEEDRRVIESEEKGMMPKVQLGSVEFSAAIFEEYKLEVYEELIDLNPILGDEIIIEMMSFYDTSLLEKEVYQFRRDLNLLMMLNEDEADIDNFIEPVLLIQQIEDPIAFLIGYLTLDELEMKGLTIHPNTLMFNLMDLEIVDIAEVSIEDLTDYYTLKSSVDFDDDKAVKITIFSTLGETVNIFVDTIDKSTYLYTVESTVELTNHSILSEYIEKYVE